VINQNRLEHQVELTQYPFSVVVDEHGVLAPATSTVQRRLSDMKGMYADSSAEEDVLNDDNPVIYEVFQADVPEFAGELVMCTTVLHPGKVGNEFFMTKGHFHSLRDRAEIYYGLTGHGLLLLAKDGEAREVTIEPGTAAYVPPFWAHRTVNTGSEPFVFLAVYPGDAGHDYGTIETDGFPQIVIERSGEAAVIANS
jgi:glucose-6-phosphate isomerase, archaeal